ncbi:uncharacterized protein F4812DRAFT_467258 [Daldinia caldariorum]|uniref:uncharacterized protein n=1 Tax=Daldinia caldariorum TaxID=326644 RepID=UPI002008BF5D|nr:uncharacterized protein F4812DRAFT_467258 [Daldinia caldariorum]KAI1471055.1 hypothetical protein F4812DRAFT_467258 [Daldinia caldariorum]
MTATEHKSPYDEAYSYVQECRSWRKNKNTIFPLHRSLEDYEAPFAIKISVGDWIRLESELEQESDETYPRLSYNASTSQLIIQCMPSPLHQSISSMIGQVFMASKVSLPMHLQNQTMFRWGVDENNFEGPWSRSAKQPDLAIQVYGENGVKKTRWVLETRFSERYEDLVSDAQLWLEGGSDVAMVMLVKFTETPKYRCPIKINDVDDDGNKLEELGIPSDRRQIAYQDVCLDEPFGPAHYQGLTWVGQITEAFMEIWIRDNGKAIQYGDREDLLSMAQVHVSFEGIFPSGYFEGITLDLEMFRSTLREQLKELASCRCRELVGRYKKKWDLFE